MLTFAALLHISAVQEEGRGAGGDDHVRVPDLLWARELKDPELVRFGDGEGVLVGVRRRPGGHQSKRESQSAFRVEAKKKNLVVQVTGGKAIHTFWGRSP